jgi:Na+/H+ antiporter NhaD/arsenite permease-like protein
VFRGIPYWIGLIVIPAVLLFMDRKALLMVDYPLLFTFVFFFVFSGNMARIDGVRHVFSMLLEKSTLLFSVVSCQVISNVPAALLLNGFTNQYALLLVGLNIGGLGTLIASMANLISYKIYVKEYPMDKGKYLGKFTVVCVLFLIPLWALAILLT